VADTVTNNCIYLSRKRNRLITDTDEKPFLCRKMVTVHHCRLKIFRTIIIDEYHFQSTSCQCNADMRAAVVLTGSDKNQDQSVHFRIPFSDLHLPLCCWRSHCIMIAMIIAYSLVTILSGCTSFTGYVKERLFPLWTMVLTIRNTNSSSSMNVIKLKPIQRPNEPPILEKRLPWEIASTSSSNTVGVDSAR